jgi:hypothetical protein
MNDEEVDRLVAQSMYSDTDVRTLDLRAGEAELMENVMNSTSPTIERPQPLRPSLTRRRSKLFTGLLLGAVVVVGGGVAYAVVADRLSPEQAQVVEELGADTDTSAGCGIDSEDARLVASTTSGGRVIEYWTVDGVNSHADLLFEDGAAFGGGGCGPISRADAYPRLPWASYTIAADPRSGSGSFTFFGQAPAGTAAVDIVMNIGTVNVEVTSPDGYFVARADLPFQAPPPPGESPSSLDAPPTIDVLERVDAYAADGTLLDTGGPAGFDRAGSRPDDWQWMA